MAMSISNSGAVPIGVVRRTVGADPLAPVPPVTPIDAERRTLDHFQAAAVVTLSARARELSARAGQTAVGSAPSTPTITQAGGDTAGKRAPGRADRDVPTTAPAGTENTAASPVDGKDDRTSNGGAASGAERGPPAGVEVPVGEHAGAGQGESGEEASEPPQTSNPAEARLSDVARQELERLKQRDKEVRAHEQAHVSVGGSIAGSASYGFEVGPDGKRYAVSGEVPIQIAPVEGSPEATIRKMQQVQRAAMAPAEPSSTDRQIAARAAALEYQARSDLAERTRDPSAEAERTGPTEPGSDTERYSGAATAESPKYSPVDIRA